MGRRAGDEGGSPGAAPRAAIACRGSEDVLPTSHVRRPARHIDMPRRACLQSRSRLGTSNPPLAGTLAANLAFGGCEQAVWRRSVRNPESASGHEPGDGFGEVTTDELLRKAGVGALAFVVCGSRKSRVESRESTVRFPPLPIGPFGDSFSPSTRPGFPATPRNANPLSAPLDGRGGRGFHESRYPPRASVERRAGSPAPRRRTAGSRSRCAASAG